MRDFSKTKLKLFGTTKLVPIVTYTNAKLDKPPRRPWTKVFFAERWMDLNTWIDSMISPEQTVLVVTRDDWQEAEVIDDTDSNN